MNINLLVDEAVFETLFIDHPLYTMTPHSFALEIERIVREQKIDYLAATAQLCEQYEIDYSSIPKLLTKTMKEKIEVSALERNYKI